MYCSRFDNGSFGVAHPPALVRAHKAPGLSLLIPVALVVLAPHRLACPHVAVHHIPEVWSCYDGAEDVVVKRVVGPVHTAVSLVLRLELG